MSTDVLKKEDGSSKGVSVEKDRGSEDGKKRRFGQFEKSRPSKDLSFDYKDIENLKRFLSEHGKIVPRRVSRLSAPQQRRLTMAVKRARQLALIPYVGEASQF